VASRLASPRVKPLAIRADSKEVANPQSGRAALVRAKGLVDTQRMDSRPFVEIPCRGRSLGRLICCEAPELLHWSPLVGYLRALIITAFAIYYSCSLLL